MQSERQINEKEVQLSNENSKQPASTDNEGTLSKSCSDKMMDIFDETKSECSHTHDLEHETTHSSEITIQLPIFDSFKSKVCESSKPAAPQCNHHRELLKTFITSKACVHSKKIKKAHKKNTKIYSLQGAEN